MNENLLGIQLFRYAVVGLLSNILVYGAYISLTWLRVEPKIAMTLVYAIGVLQTFFLNKNWSFRHPGTHGSSFARYCAAYGFGYAINLLAFLWLVDRLRYPHQVVQAAMIIIVAATVFILQRYWVFPQGREIKKL